MRSAGDRLQLSGRVWIVTGCVTVMWAAILNRTLPLYRDFRKISQAAGTTVGVVVAVDLSNHHTARYEYEANGVQYHVSEIASHDHLGDRVRVYYALSDPRLATTREPKAAARDAIMGTLWLLGFCAVGLPLLGAVRGPGGWLGLVFLTFGAVEVGKDPAAAAPLAGIVVVGVLAAISLRWLHTRRADSKLLDL